MASRPSRSLWHCAVSHLVLSFLLLLALVGTVQGAPPLLSEERPIGGPDFVFYDVGTHSSAWGQSTGLIVWAHRGSWIPCAGAYARLIDAQGGSVSQNPIFVGQCNRAVDTADVSWDGENFLVSWKISSGLDQSPEELYAARVSPEGTVLDPGGFLVTEQAHPQVSAWGGTSHLLVWHEPGGFIEGVRVSPDGQVLDQAPFSVIEVDADPELASNGDGYLLVWLADQEIRAVRLDTDGLPIDQDWLVIAPAPDALVGPTAEWTGNDYLVTWARSTGALSGLHAARVASDGSVLPPGGDQIASAWGEVSDLTLSCGDSGCLLAYLHLISGANGDHQFGPDGLRLDVTGQILGEDFDITPLPTSVSSVRSIWTGSDFLVTWLDAFPESVDVVEGNLVGPDGTVYWLLNAEYSQNLAVQFLPALAWGGNAFLVAWLGCPNIGGMGLVDAPVVNTADPQVGRGSSIDFAVHFRDAPALGWTGSSFLAVWTDYRIWSEQFPGLVAMRLSPDGSAAVANLLPIDQNVSSHTVACSPQECLVIYTKVGLKGSIIPVNYWPVSAETFDISQRPSRRPAAAWDGSEYHVVWYQEDSLRRTKVSQAGEVQTPGGELLADGVPDTTDVALSFSGDDYLVAWEGNGGIEGAFLDLTGELQGVGVFIITSEVSPIWGLGAAWGGESHMVAWEEYFPDNRMRIKALRVGGDGQVLDDPAVLVAEGTSEIGSLKVASDADGGWLLAYHRVDDQYGGPAYNVFVRGLTSRPSGRDCSSEAECSSGWCADGVCCDQPCSGQCEACDQEGSIGTCTPVMGDPKSDRPACGGAGLCRAVCDGQDPAGCTYPGDELVCAAGWCVEGVQAGPATCDGQGECQPPDVLLCGAYTCEGDTCRTSCSSDEHCATGYSCIDSACVQVIDGGMDGGDQDDQILPGSSGGCGCQNTGDGAGCEVAVLFSLLLGLGLRRRR